MRGIPCCLAGLVLCITLVSGRVGGQARTWHRTFGGTDADEALAMYPTSDGGYVLAGRAGWKGAEGRDAWLLKMDGEGNKEWDQTFGGSDDDEAHCVHPASDGGYVLVGFTGSYGAGSSDIWLIKTDADGQKQWDRTFGGADADEAHCVYPTSDGGYLLAGSTESYGAGYSDAWLIKTDGEGNREWDRTFGGLNGDWIHAIHPTSDGGYILAGRKEKSYGAENSDAWLLKTDGEGNKEWDQTFDGPAQRQDEANSVYPTWDGGYILAGSTESDVSFSDDVWLIKTDGEGNKQWDRVFGGPGWDTSTSVYPTSDGGYILAGSSESYDAEYGDVWLIKTDEEGNRQWDRVFGGVGWDRANAVYPTPDGGYLLAGCIGCYGTGISDAWLIKTDGEGHATDLSLSAQHHNFGDVPIGESVDWYLVIYNVGDRALTVHHISSDNPVFSSPSPDFPQEIPSGDSLEVTVRFEPVSAELYQGSLVLVSNDIECRKVQVVLESIPPESPNAITWVRTFGSSGKDEIKCVQQTSDGGYIFAGTTHSYGAGAGDGWLIKIDAQGYEQWRRTLGGADHEEAHSVQQTSDGGYILAGVTWGYGRSSDAWLVKTDPEGGKQWDKAFDCLVGERDEAYCVQQTSDGGYVLIGYGHVGGNWAMGIWVIKTDVQGDKEWTSFFKGEATDRGFWVQQTSDGGYILVGSYSGSYEDLTGGGWLIKLNENGKKQWDRKFVGSGTGFYCVQQTFDGGYILAGCTKPQGSDSIDGYVLKTDVEGQPQWEQTFGGAADERIRCVRQLSDGGYVLAGWTASYGKSREAWLIRTDAVGRMHWHRTFGGYEDDEANAVQPTSSGGYMLGGWTGSCAVDRKVALLIYYGPPLTGLEEMLETRSRPGIFGLAQSYPNPFNGRVIISYQLPENRRVCLTVYNVRGQRIRTLVEGERPAGHHAVPWNGRDETDQAVGSGIYLYQLQAGDSMQTKKMVLVR